MINGLFRKISDIFPGDIYSELIANKNELYIEVNPEKIIEICTYINNDLKYTLISMFANDETALNGKFAVYYAFADRNEGVILCLKTMTDPEHMAVDSISKSVPAAALYEREINDLFGIKPENHPNPKRLVFHGSFRFRLKLFLRGYSPLGQLP